MGLQSIAVTQKKLHNICGDHNNLKKKILSLLDALINFVQDNQRGGGEAVDEYRAPNVFCWHSWWRRASLLGDSLRATRRAKEWN